MNRKVSDSLLLRVVMTFNLKVSSSSSSVQEEISERDVDDSFRSMFAQLSGDVSPSVHDESLVQKNL